MPENLKDILGLDEPNTQNGASGVQATAFKKAFKAAIKEVGESLHFTAVHAVEEQHCELTGRRDKAISAYQSVAKKIDPANPRASEEAIKRVTTSISKLQSEAKALQDCAAEYHAAWVENEEELDAAAEQVAEMVEWGYSKSDKLEEVVKAIREQVKLRKYKEAVEALQKFLEKLNLAHDDYIVQRDAKIEFDQMIEDNHETLCRFGSSDHELLSDWRAEIQGRLDGIETSVESLDYSTALANLEAELPVIEDYFKEYDYESALTELQPELDKLDANLVQGMSATIFILRAKMEQAAKGGDYVLALNKLNELAPEVETKLNDIAKINYETAALSHDAIFTSADGTADEGLVPLVKANDNYKKVKQEIEALVVAEDWAGAQAMLTTKADAAKSLVDLRASYDNFQAEDARLAHHFDSLDGDYLSNLSGNPSPHPDWEEDVKLYRAYKRKTEQGDYEGATKAMQALAPRIATLESRVNASDVEATAKADAAANKIRALIGGASLVGISMDDGITLIASLQRIPFKQRTQLLEDLHGPSATLTGEQWIMQQAIYEASDLDKSFKKQDDKIRQQYLNELKNNKEVQHALAHWNDTDSTGTPVMDRAAKEKILKQIIATQSKAYNTDEPKINWSPTQATSVAEFKADSCEILIDPATLGDPKELVRAVLHENTHNFQDSLGKKYLSGEIDKRDPMYEQAKMFAINFSGDGYITEAQHREAYKVQPTELHAHDAGDKGAIALILGV